MKSPIVEHTETLTKHGYAVYIFDPEDGGPLIFKIARDCSGACVVFTKEELKRWCP